ncbi:MAG: inositol monophosphatase family protein [Actinomycetota bacterium]
MRVDAARVGEIIREAADAEVLPRFRRLAAHQIREKKPGQLVTEADTAAEAVLARRLTELVPAAVVGEEGVDADPALLKALEHDGPVWVIDPVDGTANFAAGRARFAVVVALVVDGTTVAGWILDPVPGRMVVAEVGSGAWLGETRLSVMPEVGLRDMLGSVKKSGRVAGAVRQVARKGSAAHDYVDLVTGRLHFAHFRRLMPWDHAAGVLIHAEAGGYASLLDGRAYSPARSDGDLLLTPGQASWDALAGLVE